MINKLTLTEQNIFYDYFPIENSFVDIEKIKFNILKNYWGKYKQSFNISDSHHYYYNLTPDKNVTWVLDWIRDQLNLKQDIKWISLKKRCLIQNQGESINFHKHIDEHDLNGSPTLSGIYTVDCGKETSDLIFKYSQGKNIGTYSIPMEKNKVIIFNSELEHSFEKNKNEEPIFNICFTFNFE
tara:strand:- start:1346 stop:1894 length:549 start_codon:yes stop_codon:yes gene_type:complete